MIEYVEYEEPIFDGRDETYYLSVNSHNHILWLRDYKQIKNKEKWCIYAFLFEACTIHELIDGKWKQLSEASEKYKRLYELDSNYRSYRRSLVYEKATSDILYNE